MLCSKCHKEIPKGEEVTKVGIGIHWRVGWVGGIEGRENKIFCVRCAKQITKKRKKILMTLYWVFSLIIILLILVITFSIVSRGQKS